MPSRVRSHNPLLSPQAGLNSKKGLGIENKPTVDSSAFDENVFKMTFLTGAINGDLTVCFCFLDSLPPLSIQHVCLFGKRFQTHAQRPASTLRGIEKSAYEAQSDFQVAKTGLQMGWRSPHFARNKGISKKSRKISNLPTLKSCISELRRSLKIFFGVL